jgi:hypothetical protein
VGSSPTPDTTKKVSFDENRVSSASYLFIAHPNERYETQVITNLGTRMRAKLVVTDSENIKMRTPLSKDAWFLKILQEIVRSIKTLTLY